ncbi:hypothetical protein GCM10007301_37190 [Azorhizobium oxalatiphilum]|uniref:K(+)-transporting ATPase subunit F n=1 Tax=Azorhizobium oxalatiphilum TaxID=980631 RepID=A0A917C670_9HYPH|nr:hypothetical protein GCM10007301_37190 [Azorhizobium oxalatiphilum]
MSGFRIRNDDQRALVLASQEVSHGRRHLSSHRHRLLRPHDGLRPLGDQSLKGVTMFALSLGAAVSIGLALYLLTALIRPERF